MKKRIMGIALAAVMGVVSMTGCGSGSDSKKDSTKVKVQTTLTDNGLWDYEMLVDGKVLKAPITSKTLNARDTKCLIMIRVMEILTQKASTCML